MEEKIRVLGIEIDNCTVKDAMKCVVEHLNDERMNVVEMVTMNTLASFQKSEEEKTLFSTFDIAFPSDKGILQAAGIEEEKRLKEVDELLFIKMVMRLLNANKKRVFLLAKTEDALRNLEEFVEDQYGGIKVVDCTSLDDGVESDEMLLNLINGAEVECVISALPSPVEEYFVARHKSLVNARLWLGLGHLLGEIKKEKKGFQRLKEFIWRRILKKEVEKERKRNMEE